jgi:hypothetical protein
MINTFTTAQEVIAVYGEPRIAQRHTTVGIRQPNGTETFKHKNGDLTAVPEIDYVVVPTDGSLEYPCKIDLFHKAWVETEPGSSVYHRKPSRVIQVPEGDLAIINSREGESRVAYPDFIALGLDDEVYCHSKEWVDKNLNFVN